MQGKIKNISDLIKDLSEAYEQLREKNISHGEAKQIANIGGKLIKAASVQLKYNQYMQDFTPIEFLEKSGE